jgi:hypothetical protein
MTAVMPGWLIFSHLGSNWRLAHWEELPMAANGHQRITRQEPGRARRRERGATTSEVTEQQLEDMRWADIR